MMRTSQTSSIRPDSPRGVKAERLSREFQEQGRTSGDGALLLWSTGASELVNRAADEGVPILRITAVAPAGAARDAALDHAVDFSREVGEGHGCWEAADAFIRRRGELGLLFNVELGDDPLEIV